MWPILGEIMMAVVIFHLVYRLNGRFLYCFFNNFCGRRGGLMVSALDSGSGGPGSSPGRGTALCS